MENIAPSMLPLAAPPRPHTLEFCPTKATHRQVNANTTSISTPTALKLAKQHLPFQTQ
jgi:hypothetical protein